MLTIRAMADGKGYSARHLEHNDYYAEGERVTGEWHGHGTQLLGLSGEVAGPDFEAVRQGLDPTSLEFLRVRQSADRMAPDGTKLTQARSLFDFTISAPKSVSILAILGDDRRLVEAHKAAVEETLDEIEAHASSRIRRAGANQDRTSGNLVVAVYHHDTSRELDPQLHTHAVAANLTFDGAEGRWKALQASGIYERRAYLTEVYRNALARELRRLGYEIENRRDAKGSDSGFEIRGVSKQLQEKFSQRSAQRDRAIQDFVTDHGRRPTDNEVAVLVRESRADKLIEISTGALRQVQKARLAPAEQEMLAGLLSALPRIPPDAEPSRPSFEHAKEHVFERASVARDHEILAEALRHGRGRIRLEELKREAALQASKGGILQSGGEVSTAESLLREREMIAAINRGLGSFEPLGAGLHFVASDRLRAEQRQAVEFVLQSRDRAVSVSGAAGTGKTATLQELRRALTEAGRVVLAVAPTMSAVEELHQVGFTNAVTLERLLQDSSMHSKAANAVLILDEAGMVSARQMSDFLRLAETARLRIVFSGDTSQIQSVEAGDALRVLETESWLKSVALKQVQRQTSRGYRGAIEELRRNPERGFLKLEAIGAVHEVEPISRAQTVAAAYVARIGKTTLVVCPTHEEIGRVTEAIRASRRMQGELGSGISLTRHASLNWTAAQKTDFQNYRPGQILGFHRSANGIAKHASAEVKRVEGGSVVVQTEAGEERRITMKQVKCFDVLEALPTEVAPGDRLLLTANRSEAGLRITNGELVIVGEVDPAGRILLDDGRSLPANYRHFMHGYAVTAHRSQGKSVDAVIISADGMQKELFYVAASRGRESVTVITSDKERLKEAVAKSMVRKSASELVRGAGPIFYPSCPRGVALARRLIQAAAEFIESLPKTLTRAVAVQPGRDGGREHGLSR